METVKPRVVKEVAYQLTEINGGFQLWKYHVENGKIATREKVSDPDAWEQSISLLEAELSRQFQ